MLPTPNSNARSVAQRARRERERLQRAAIASPTPNSNAHSVAQRARRERERIQHAAIASPTLLRFHSVQQLPTPENSQWRERDIPRYRGPLYSIIFTYHTDIPFSSSKSFKLSTFCCPTDPCCDGPRPTC